MMPACALSGDSSPAASSSGCCFEGRDVRRVKPAADTAPLRALCAGTIRAVCGCCSSCWSLLLSAAGCWNGELPALAASAHAQCNTVKPSPCFAVLCTTARISFPAFAALRPPSPNPHVAAPAGPWTSP